MTFACSSEMRTVSTEEFRRIWKDIYGPLYRQMPQVKSYVQYHLQDRRKGRR